MVCIQVSLTQAQISVNLQQLTDASEQNKEENHKSFIFSPETNKKVKMILRSMIWWRHDVMIWWCNDLMIWWWVCDEAAVKHSNSTNMSTSECSGSACDWCQNPASELGLIRFDWVWLGLIGFDSVWLVLIRLHHRQTSCCGQRLYTTWSLINAPWPAPSRYRAEQLDPWDPLNHIVF